jgi:hypothetical protein
MHNQSFSFTYGFLGPMLMPCYSGMCLNSLAFSQDIFSLCQALPSLEVLDLTNNRMENDIAESPVLKNIRVLVLNNCGVTWELVCVMLHGNHLKIIS